MPMITAGEQGGHMQAGIEHFLRRVYDDAHEVVIEGFAPLPGGYSRETFICDAVVHTAEHPSFVTLPVVRA